MEKLIVDFDFFYDTIEKIGDSYLSSEDISMAVIFQLPVSVIVAVCSKPLKIVLLV